MARDSRWFEAVVTAVWEIERSLDDERVWLMMGVMGVAIRTDSCVCVCVCVCVCMSSGRGYNYEYNDSVAVVVMVMGATVAASVMVQDM